MGDQDNFSIWIGDVKIIKADEINENQNKFETCEHNTGLETRDKKSCCTTVQQTGYFCSKRNIWMLQPSQCNNCTEFSKKTS